MEEKTTTINDLLKREKALQERSAEIDGLLIKYGYNETLLREQRNITMHLTTCKQRIAGQWLPENKEEIQEQATYKVYKSNI